MPSSPSLPKSRPRSSGSVPSSYHSATCGASSLCAKSRTVSRIARSSSLNSSSTARKSCMSAPLPVGFALLVEGGVELRVVMAGHEQGLGHRVELHGRPDRHVELTGDQRLGLL